MPDPKLSGQWGILGGTFDPVHLGHLTLAAQIRKQRELTGVVLIPAFIHAFKSQTTSASYDDRLAMLKLAVSNYDDLSVSSIERDLNLSGLTVDTIIAVKKKYPETEFFFLIGADNLSQLSSWHKSKEITQEARILVGCRPGFNFVDEFEKTGMNVSDFEAVKTDELAISSTEIRAMIRKDRQGDTIKNMVPQQVIQYIKDNGLYS